VRVWDVGVQRFVKESNESFSVFQFLGHQDIMAKSDWNDLAMTFLTDPKKNSDGGKLLRSPSVMKNKNWEALALAYIESSQDDLEISNLLVDEYVENKPEWQKLARKFLEKAQNEEVKDSFLNNPKVAKL